MGDKHHDYCHFTDGETDRRGLEICAMFHSEHGVELASYLGLFNSVHCVVGERGNDE